MPKDEKRREIYIDALRIIACLMVIFEHSGERGFYRYATGALGGYSFVWHMFCSIACKIAVPTFFMISGSLLLSKEESILDTYKRIPRILIDLLLFSLLYYGMDAKLDGEIFSLKNTLKTILQINYWHLWYLYAYIAFIITLPFLRKMVRGLDEKSALYMLVIAVIIMGIIPIFEYFQCGIYDKLEPGWLLYNNFIYPVAGYTLDSVFDPKRIRRKLSGMWLITLLCFVISSICEYGLLIREANNTVEIFISNFVLMNSVTLFVTVKCLMAEWEYNNAVYRLITEVGKCTFGIYLLHILFLWKIPFFYDSWMKIEEGSALGHHVGIFITCILVFCICCAVTYIFRKIPVVRKLF